MSFDIVRLRAETPGCSNVIHLNNAAAALPPSPVLAAMEDYFRREAAIGPVEAAEEASEQLEDTYRQAALLLDCQADEIAILNSQSRAAQLALLSIPLKKGDRVLITREEWGGQHVNLLARAAEMGASVEFMPTQADGTVDVVRLSSMLDERVKLVHLTWLPANNGLVHPAEQIGTLLMGSGIFYMIDASQAVGQIPIDISRLHCDLLSAPCRKWLRGPRGTALLYIRKSILDRLIPPPLDVFSAPWRNGAYTTRPDTRRYETSERSFLLQRGLGAAIHYALDIGIEEIHAAVQERARYLREALSQTPFIRVHDRGSTLSGIIAITHDRISSVDLRRMLSQRGVNVGAPGIGYTPLDDSLANKAGALRVAPHYYNSMEELARFIAILQGITGD